ncbi:cytochrome c biogenesis protein ResB [Aeromicrobium piscarium]|uniref:Cytochrome c biogenesis protein ResB n=1 Tax=Aeromicrobium piscarium TaxID=2590901 RepID=A0A554RVR0_9ACTN|nr:cytochrome c biogenesis protein ResB [Aeromicrobium piscarium]TSD58160.1 cytochrome c biogenesis protein ResB [Aeromicrobium piscarium]
MNPSTQASELTPRQFVRWMWRQLTSMRTALFLLLLLAVAAVPGSLVPQRGVDARAVQAFFQDHPTLAPVLDAIGMFSVYSSPWFSAIYLLLMLSLVGCIVPRIGVYAKALRARPPRAPRNFARLPGSGSFTTTASVDEVVSAGRQMLGRARIDVVQTGNGTELRAEKGYLRELGNLVFHCSILVVLVGVAIGALWSYRGAVMVTEGDGFSNTLSQYDEFNSGPLYDPDNLPPFGLTVDRMIAEFHSSGPQMGAPRLFQADVTYTERPGDEPQNYEIVVNNPLSLDGGDVFLIGQGYAPVIRVTDANGEVVFDDAVIFLPQDGTYLSEGVVKVPDAAPEQLGFQGFFMPTAVSTGDDAPTRTVYPGAVNPVVGLRMWSGDLGLDDGTPQSVYTLQKEQMTEVLGDDGEPFNISLSPGQVQDLPGGGSIEFVDLQRFARFQIADVPAKSLPLVGVSVGLIGLMASLMVRPRRTWITATTSTDEAGRTLTSVNVGVLDRVPRDETPIDLDAFLRDLQQALPTSNNLKETQT